MEMFRIPGFCYLLLVCSLQQAASEYDFPSKWLSSPAYIREGRRYDKLQEVFQGYPVDRRNTDQTYKWLSTCEGLSGRRETTHLSSYRYESYSYLAAKKSKPCYSVLRNCYFEEPLNDDVIYCVSGDPTRRYDFMEREGNPLKSSIVYGHKYGQCDLSRVEQFFPYGAYASTCVCDCESSEKEVDRYFSLLDVLADDDKVVTGVRLRKVDHVFYIQIQQGKLGKSSQIDGKVEWKDIEAISKDDLLSKKVSEYYKAGDDNDVKFRKNNLVYAVTSQQNTLLLDDLHGEPMDLVTGVRFQQVDDDLRLEILLTYFDYSSGKMRKDRRRWVYYNGSGRKEVEIESLGIPTPHTVADITSPNRSFVKFRTSDFKKDLGQTTVPLIEIHDIVDEQPQPLYGVGIFHKGDKDTAGFIALKGFYEIVSEEV